MIFYYLMLINVITFLAFGIDKWKAKHNRWRIKEATLLGLSLIGGGVGGYAAMLLFHHKTRKARFRFGVPVMLILWIVIMYMYYVK